MKTIEDYFNYVRQIIKDLAHSHFERYEEQILSVNRGNLRVRLRFPDQALLEISEAVVFMAGKLCWLCYRYHYQDPSAGVVFRYDNAPHHPEIPTHPDHKYTADSVLASSHPSIEQVVLEVRNLRGRRKR